MKGNQMKTYILPLITVTFDSKTENTIAIASKVTGCSAIRHFKGKPTIEELTKKITSFWITEYLFFQDWRKELNKECN